MKLLKFISPLIKKMNQKLIKMNLPKLLKKRWFKIFMIFLSLFLGCVISALTLFHVLFLSKVLPHGGL